MSGACKVIICGNLGATPKLEKTRGGTPFVDFSLAVNEKWTDSATKEKKERVSWFDCVVYGKQAENLAEYKRQGDQLLVFGRGQQEKWVDKTTGKNRYAVRFVADEIQFIGGKREDSETDKRESGRADNRDKRAENQQMPPADDDRPPYNDEDAAREGGASPDAGPVGETSAEKFKRLNAGQQSPAAKERATT